MTTAWRWPVALCLLAAVPVQAAGEEPTVEQVVARHLAARGGVERWQAVESLELRGTYAAFSYRSPFTLLRKRGDLYRLDFTLLGAPAVRARDADGPWWLHKLLQPEPGRLTEGPYKAQLERESLFGPPLVEYESRGLSVELIGPGDVDGRPTVGLRVVFPGDREEVWHLGAATWLEVAVDSEVPDLTQSNEPVRQRAFFDDFREVDGLVLPFQIDLEFGHRLESMTVEEVRVDPPIDEARLRLPSPPAADEQAPEDPGG